MASPPSSCRHRWVNERCTRCGMVRHPRATRSRSRRGASVSATRAVTTADFDPWRTTPLGPSLLAAPGAPPGAAEGPPAPPGEPALEEELYALVNAARERAGRAPLRLDVGLRAVARAHSADMGHRGFFAHQTPEGLGPGDRALRAGIVFRRLAENIGRTADLAEAQAGLLTNPGCRANLLEPHFRRIGIGVVRAPSGHLYITQDLAD